MTPTSADAILCAQDDPDDRLFGSRIGSLPQEVRP